MSTVAPNLSNAATQSSHITTALTNLSVWRSQAVHSTIHRGCVGHIPCDWLQDLVRRDEELYPHLHNHVDSLRDLLAQWVPQIHPQPLPALVLVAQSEILLLQQTQSLTNLEGKDFKRSEVRVCFVFGRGVASSNSRAELVAVVLYRRV